MERKSVMGFAALMRALNDRMALWLDSRLWERLGIRPTGYNLKRILWLTRNGKKTGASIITLLHCKYARLLFKEEVDEKTEAIQLCLLIATLAIGAMTVLLSELRWLWR